MKLLSREVESRSSREDLKKIKGVKIRYAKGKGMKVKRDEPWGK